jgi:hypothetical protein
MAKSAQDGIGRPHYVTRAKIAIDNSDATVAADQRVIDRLSEFETGFMRERFADFERSVLQDNIILCDTKCGVLLAFTGAMVILSLDALQHLVASTRLSEVATYAGAGVFVLAALGFLVSCGFSLATVMPRIRKDAPQDHIFWESEAFKKPVAEYVAAMNSLNIDVEHNEKLVHLHTLARVCRGKFSSLRHAMNSAIVGFAFLVIGECVKAAA